MTPPLKLLEVLERTTAFLASKGVPDPRLDAQYLLAHGLGMKRLDLYLNYDRPLTPAELEVLRPLVKRRSSREPLQHILGNTPFRKLDLRTDARALIPRPETEGLVDIALELLRTHFPVANLPVEDASNEKTANHADPIASPPELPWVVEVGVGSGAIILSLATEFPQARYWGCDISPEALNLARENLLRCAPAAEPTLVQSDLLASLPMDTRPWLIISNPPYIARGELATLQEEVKRDPRTALDGGPDGLECIRRLITQAAQRLAPGGALLIEIGHDQEDALVQLGQGAPWENCEVRKDWNDSPRYAVLRRS